MGSIMSTLDGTIVNVALNSLSRDLHTRLSDIQWVVSAYLLALAAVIPLCGWATRRFGAYRVYMRALILFTLGSTLCGLATTGGELVAFRALQGLGGGLLNPTGIALLIQAAGRKNVPRVMSIFGATMVVAPVLGPTLGGLLLQSVGWHAIFFINVPLGIATVVAASRLLPRDQPDRGEVPRLDWPGLILASLGTVGVTYGLSQVATAGRFDSGSVLAPLLGGLLLLTAFLIRARWVAHPLLDLKLYAIRAYSSATVVVFFMGAAVFGAMILMPLYYQIVRGHDAATTGLLLIPQGVGAAIGSTRSAQTISRLGAGLTALCGVTIVLVATTPFLFLGPTTPYWLIMTAMLVRGIGLGSATIPAMVAAFSVLDHHQVNDASPQLNVVQRIGGSLGTAIIAVVLQARLAHAIGQQAANATAKAGAVAMSFDQTYKWVMLISACAVPPALVLWRVERRLSVDDQRAELQDETVMDVVT
jgi:EmrB/QacA subfamily drug resistance transporter